MSTIYAEKNCSYVGFFRNEELAVMRIFPVKRPKMDVEEGDELLTALIE